jgi:hypothetical protein
MSNTLYAELGATVLELLQEFGGLVTVTTPNSVYSVASGSRTVTPTTAQYWGVDLRNFSRLMSDYRIVGNSSTMKTDVCVLFGPDAVIADDATLSLDGEPWGVFRVDKVKPADVVVYQRVWVRR